MNDITIPENVNVEKIGGDGHVLNPDKTEVFFDNIKSRSFFYDSARIFKFKFLPRKNFVKYDGNIDANLKDNFKYINYNTALKNYDIELLKRKYETKVIFRVRKKLVHLFKKNEFEVISETDPLPHHDYHCLLLSLPKIFFEKEKKLAKRINYINVDEKIILKWKDKLSSIKGYKVGINWQGDPKSDLSRLRSTPLNLFETFFSIENLNFISLQKGAGSEQIQNFKHRDRLYDFMSDADNKNAFEDTIGILKNLDLVITSDTSLAHVSSTLGVKTWVLLPISPHWTWFLDSDRSPWYENTKLYRQKKFNEWDSVFSTVKKDLINEYNISK